MPIAIRRYDDDPRIRKARAQLPHRSSPSRAASPNPFQPSRPIHKPWCSGCYQFPTTSRNRCRGLDEEHVLRGTFFSARSCLFFARCRALDSSLRLACISLCSSTSIPSRRSSTIAQTVLTPYQCQYPLTKSRPVYVGSQCFADCNRAARFIRKRLGMPFDTIPNPPFVARAGMTNITQLF